jgi:hypothetical protein
MTNPTTNFGWVMPSPTDLVTDLPADFEVFGQAVDTDFVDLLGGANGYILSKASATDLDFAWIPNDQGDITAVNVTAPITGGGSSGAVTIGVDAASTAAAGVGTAKRLNFDNIERSSFNADSYKISLRFSRRSYRKINTYNSGRRYLS